MIKTIWQQDSGVLRCEFTWNTAWKCSEVRLLARADGSTTDKCIYVFRPSTERQAICEAKLDYIEKGHNYSLSVQPKNPEGDWCFPREDWLGVNSFFHAYKTTVFWCSARKGSWALVESSVCGDPLPIGSLLVQTKEGAFPFPAEEAKYTGRIALWVKVDGGKVGIVCQEKIEVKQLPSASHIRKHERKTR